MRAVVVRSLAFIVVLIAGLAASASVVFGPKTYTRGSGEPTPVTEQFVLQHSCDLTSSARYILRVANDNVSSATIAVNGAEIVRERDLNPQVTTIEREIFLQRENAISITIKGAQSDGALTLTIDRIIEPTQTLFAEAFTFSDTKPQTFTKTFDVADLTEPFSLVLRNGDGGAAAANLDVTLNGSVILSSADLVHPAGPEIIRKSVALQAHNTLEVTLRQPSRVSVEILRHVTDTAGPDITITSPEPGDRIASSPLIVTGSISDDSGVAALTINGTTAIPGPDGSFSASIPLTLGETLVTVGATDCLGNASTRQLSVTLGDPTPVITISAPTDLSVTRDPAVTVRGSVLDTDLATVMVNGQAALVEGSQWRATIALVGPDGLHGLTATATDLAGHGATASVKVLLDTTPPQAFAAATTEPGSGGWHFARTMVQFSCTDGLGSGVVECPAPIAFTEDARERTINATVHDRAGNTTTASITVNVDVTAPLLTINGSAERFLTNSETVTFSGSVSDTTSGIGVVTCNDIPSSIDGANFTCTSNMHEGVNVIRFLARDRAGNTAFETREVEYDATAPAIVITTPSQIINGPHIMIEGVVSDGGGVYNLTVNAATVAVDAGAFSAPVALVPGENVVAVEAVDKAGNRSSTSVTLTRQDTLGITIMTPHDLAVVTTAVVDVAGTLNGPASDVRVNGVVASVSGNTFEAQGVPLQQGRTVITVIAQSQNAISGSASIFVYRDSIPPRINVRTPPNGTVVHDEQVQIAGLIDDIVVGTVNAGQATVTVNGTPAVVSNRTFLATIALTPGPNAVLIDAIDQAGNRTEIIHHLTFDSAPRARIRPIAGNDQEAVIGTLLPQPVTVRVTDAAGAPVAGKEVTFGVHGSNGRLLREDQSGRRLTFVTDAEGEASVQWQLGTRAGAGNDQLEVSANGYASALFVATATAGPPNLIVVDSGNSQFGAVAQRLPRPLIVAVVDAGSNRLSEIPVTFSVTEGDGSLDGETTRTVITDSDGRAWVTPTLGPGAGNDNNVITATLPSSGQTAEFVASGRVPDAAGTRIVGIVADNSDIPIAGVTLRVDGTTITTQTNAQGQFTLSNVPVGYVKLFVDGSTAPRPGVWPTIEYAMFPIAGIENRLEMPIYLLPIDVQRGISVTETQGGTLTIPELPGFALTVAPGSALFPNGSRAGTVSATLVHADKMPMAPAFGQQPQFVVTVQPPGVHFDPPAAVTFPNVDGLAPGEITELYSFDHDLGQFLAIGTGSVSEDGSTLRSDPGVGLIKGGWQCGGNPPATGTSSCVKVSIRPAETDILAGGETEVTATGTPAEGGRYFNWNVVDDPSDPDDDPSIATFATKPTCAGQKTCTATLRATDTGTVTVQVSFAAKEGTVTSEQKKISVSTIEVDTMQALDDELIGLPDGSLVPEFIWPGPANTIASRPIASDFTPDLSERAVPATNETGPGGIPLGYPVRLHRSLPPGTGFPNGLDKVMVFAARFTMKGNKNPIPGAIVFGKAYTYDGSEKKHVANFYQRDENGNDILTNLPADGQKTDVLKFKADTSYPRTSYKYDPLVIDWYYKVGNGKEKLFRTTAKRVWITLAARGGRDLRGGIIHPSEEILDIAIGSGGATTGADALPMIWQRFSTRGADNQEIPANIRTFRGDQLSYYSVLAGGVTTPVTGRMGSDELLTIKNGQCRTFVDLLETALAVSSVESTRFQITHKSSAFMFVGRWEYAANPSDPPVDPMPIPTPRLGTYYVLFELRKPEVPGMGQHQTTPDRWYGDIRSRTDGIPGQNSPSPLQKVFYDHVILKVNGKFYDPSYGLTYATEQEFQDRAIEALGVPESVLPWADPTTGVPTTGLVFWVNILPPGSPLQLTFTPN